MSWDIFFRFSKSLRWLVPLFFLTLFLLQVFFIQPGFPYTHDGENHLARFMNYAAAVREGQFPPRFAPYINSGFGFPVFHYNYPAANIFAIPFIWLHFHPATVFFLLTFVSCFVGAAHVFLLLRSRLSVTVSWYAVLWYLSGTYLFSNLLFRGNIGETLVYGIVPVIFWWWSKYFTKSDILTFTLSLFSFVVLLLAHNVFAVVFVPILLVWSLSLAFERHVFRQWAALWFSAFGLVSWFWIPALAELNLVVLTQDSLANQAALHGLTLSQFLFSPLQFGFSRPGTIDSFGFGFGWQTVLLFVLAITFFLSRFLANRKPLQFRKVLFSHEERMRFFFIVLFFACTYLSLSASSWWWNVLPGIRLLQFPWRLEMIVGLLLPVIFAGFFSLLSWKGRALAWILLISHVVTLWQLKPVDRVHYEASYYLSFPHSTTTRNENRPRTLTAEALPSWQPTAKILSGEGEVARVDSWLGSRHSYQVFAKTDVVVQEPTIYFPGWKTTDETGETQEQVFSAETEGFIAYALPARPEKPYEITTSFSERTAVRVWSESITLFTIFTLSTAGVLWWKKGRL